MKMGAESVVVLDVETLHCKALDSEIQLPVPRISQSSTPAKPTLRSAPNLEFLVSAHAKYRCSADSSLRTDPATIKVFTKEVENVRLMFPSVNNELTILALVAWSCVLLSVDDLIEDMDSTIARVVLWEVKNSTLKNLNINWIKYPEIFENCPSALKTEHILRTFLSHMKTLLPANVFIAFVEDIGEWIAGMMDEALFRERPPPDFEIYMKIRRRTIGTCPFITLAQWSLSKNYMANESWETISVLKTLSSEVLGLQNDLIGLDKDLSVHWPLNAVIVGQSLKASFSEDDGVQSKESLREVESMYAVAVNQAVDTWKEIQASPGSEAEKELSNIIMIFVERCLKWAVACKRYKTG